ncbi:divergent polysaccharide deacetylase family protein [Rhodobacteraceae bacterium KMM 6894]|nr:divergent polysaccharide deacetylase family protein [Rhodobacteraceae bacterium KMM 6894]
MAQGFVAGLLAGVVVSTVGLGAVSVVSGPVGVKSPDATALDVPAGSEFNQSLEDTAARLPTPDVAPVAAGDTPQVATAAPDDLSTLGAEATQPSARPQLGTVQGDLSAPQVPAEDSGVVFETATPTQPDTPLVPEAPASARESNVSISTDPAQPAVPEAPVDDAAFPKSEPAPQSDSAPEVTAQTAPEAEPEVEPETLPKPTPAEGTGTIGNLATGVATNRLPSVTDSPVSPVEQAAPAVSDRTLPAIQANAEPFDAPDGKPLMAIILIDDGSSPIGLEALSAFPYPLSFAVDAMAPGATEAMQRYRDAGFEVLALANLPDGAQAVDTEITMQTVLTAIPKAVAILEGTGTGLQISRDASEQLAPILLESGHGLVMFSNGLNTASKLISREGVPVGTVFRDFDANGQSATVIRRFLDQAAFKAGREEGGVIMLGRLRADTISALLLWGLQDRASQVELAPISAVLMQGQPTE